MKRALLSVLLLLPASAGASGFEWRGVRSGMTPDEVKAKAPAGSALRLNGDFGFVEASGDTQAAVTFCKGRLVSLSQTIDPDAEWFSLAGRMLRQYGAPRVEAAADPWPGAGSGGGSGVEMSWRAGSNRYALTAWPTVPPHAGQPRPVRRASLAVTDLGLAKACKPKAPKAKASAVKHHAKVRKVKLVRPRGLWRPPPYPAAKPGQPAQAIAAAFAGPSRRRPARAVITDR